MNTSPWPGDWRYRLRRLQLRALRASDLEAFLVYRNDPAVARYQGWAPMTVVQAAAFIDAHATASGLAPGAWRQWAIAEMQSDRLVGDLGVWLAPDGSEAEFGITITPAAQRLGYASEAVHGLLDLLFARPEIREVRATTDIRNRACLTVLERAGMPRVGSRFAEYKSECCTEVVFCVSRLDR